MNLLLQIEGIHKWYGKVHALKGLNLDVRAGEVVALIGDNGAGKSTLIKIISGVVPPSEGKIYFKGEEVNIDSVSTARKLGIEAVHQDRTIIGDLDVTKNIFLTREETKSFGPFKILDHRKMREVAKTLTENMGLKISSPDQEVRFCSGGERQGIAIARAMHFKSKLVILDEPTTALSVKGVEKVLNFVNHLKEENIGVIYITHSLRSGYHAARSSGVSFCFPRLTPTIKPGGRTEVRSRWLRKALPRLGKPSRLINEVCRGRRKIRGRGFPGCGCGVTVPNSTCPKPRAASPRQPMASLS